MEKIDRNMIARVGCYACRFLLGAVLVFSGFVKAVDPMGTNIKLEEYLKAFGMADFFYDWLILLAAILLATVEFGIGIYLVIGIRRKIASTIALILMSIMTPLTLYLWIADPVSDCGCFGDALILTNAETFLKNLILWGMAVITFRWNRQMKRLITPKSDWIISLYTMLFGLMLSAHCLRNLPIIDFRPYRIGVNIPQAMAIPEGAAPDVWESRFVLEKDGERRTFTLDNYPDSTWTYISTESILKQKGYQPAIHDFSIQRMTDGEEITDSILSAPGYTFLLVAPHIETADDSNIDLINEIYDYCIEHQYGFIALTASSEAEVEMWCERTGGEYPFAMMDEVTLKTMIRSNPGLIMLKEGTIYNKWSNATLPDEYMLTDRLEQIPLGELQIRSDWRTIGYVLLWFVVPLLFVILLDILWIRRRKPQNPTVKEKETDTIQ
ncbi:MAG: BT_3928 family protein [Bacteroides sp.]